MCPHAAGGEAEALHAMRMPAQLPPPISNAATHTMPSALVSTHPLHATPAASLVVALLATHTLPNCLLTYHLLTPSALRIPEQEKPMAMLDATLLLLFFTKLRSTYPHAAEAEVDSGLESTVRLLLLAIVAPASTNTRAVISSPVRLEDCCLLVHRGRLLLHHQACHLNSTLIAAKCILQSTLYLALPLRAVPLILTVVQPVVRILIYHPLTLATKTAMARSLL